MYSCPDCEQLINQASEVCPYCGADQKALADTELLLAGKTPKPARTNYQRVALVCGILLAILWAIAWFAVPWKLSGSKTEAERLQGGLREGMIDQYVEALQQQLGVTINQQVLQAAEGG